MIVRRAVTGTAILAALGCAPAAAGPIHIYRTGPQFCPHDRAPDSPRITAAQAIERALALLPDHFCGPTWFVSGCDAEPEFAENAWRVFVRQYKLRDGARDFGGLEHTYVVLDRVGNCYANIPGTVEGSTHE
ncbi:MAG: hypothetical protein JSS46_14670 [Proteobacteria bacterium]|nr:hypothetical protein [Pseudomonadota bacterium]